MVAEEKKSAESVRPNYVSGASSIKFDVARLPGFGAELSKMFESLVIYPNETFSAEIPDLVSSIPAQIEDTLAQIQELKKTDPALGDEMETKYLRALHDYVRDIEQSFKVLVPSAFLSLILTLGLGSSLEVNTYAPLEGSVVMLLFILFFLHSLLTIRKLWRRTTAPYHHLTERLDVLHEKVEKDLRTAAAGRVPPRFVEPLNRLLTGDQNEIVADDQVTRFAQRLELINQKDATTSLLSNDFVEGDASSNSTSI